RSPPVAMPLIEPKPLPVEGEKDGPFQLESDWVTALAGGLTNSIGMKLVVIPPGKFLMGSPTDEAGRRHDEGPEHEVEITWPFCLGMYEVTQEEFERVMSYNPSMFSAKRPGIDMHAGLDTRRFPVEDVSWNEAVRFCRRLSERREERVSG